jgi:hypothetical protein
MALVISKHIELKAGVSVRKFLDESKKIVDGQILNEMTNKIITVKAEPTQKMKDIMQRLIPPH